MGKHSCQVPRNTLKVQNVSLPAQNKLWHNRPISQRFCATSHKIFANGPSMKDKKLENFRNKISLTGSKWSNLNAPMSETPVSHSLLSDSLFPILPFSLWGNKELDLTIGPFRKDFVRRRTKSLRMGLV